MLNDIITKSYEKEVKVFGLDNNLISSYLSSITTPIEQTYGIQTFKKNKDTIKILTMNDGIYLQRKAKTKKVDGAKTAMEYIMPISDVEGVINTLNLLGCNNLYAGTKNRLTWNIPDDINITLDTWIEGPLLGVQYIEVESTNKKKPIEFKKIIKTLFEQSGHQSDTYVYICEKGTITLMKYYDKLYKNSSDFGVISFDKWIVNNPVNKKNKYLIIKDMALQ